MDSVHVFSYLKTKFKKNKNMGLFDNKENYNTGRSWHLDRQKHNKSEDWEKPMDERKQDYADGGGVFPKLSSDKIKFYKLADILDLDLEYDGDETDLRLHGSEMLNWGAETEAEYKEATDAIDAISFKGNGWEVYAWYDVSGFNYWMVQQEEQNYINVTIMFAVDSIDASEIPAIKNAMESAYSEAYSISEKYDYVPNSEYKRGGKVDGRSTRAKNTWNSGASWTRDRNAHNKSEDWEKPMNKRKYDEGGGVDTYYRVFDNQRGIYFATGYNATSMNELIEDFQSYILGANEIDFEHEQGTAEYEQELNNFLGTWDLISEHLQGVELEESSTPFEDEYEFKGGGRIKSALMRDRAYKSNEPHEQAYKRKSRPKNPRYAKYAEGGGVDEFSISNPKDLNEFWSNDENADTQIFFVEEMDNEDDNDTYYVVGNQTKKYYEDNKYWDYDYSFKDINDAIKQAKEDAEKHGGVYVNNVKLEYAEGGSVKSRYNTGRSWHSDRRQHNKSEDWEKPLSERASANRSASKGSAAKSKSPKGKSKNYMYIPNYMIRGAEVNNSGKTTDIDGGNILDGIYVKKGTKYAKGGGVGAKKSKKQKAIDLLVKNIKYSFVNTDMGSGWKFVLYAPFSTSGYGKDVLEEMKYLDMFDADDMGIEDYDNLSKKDKDYYYNDWKNQLFDTYFEVFKDKVTPKYLHFFEEELQKDEFGNGGNVGRDLLFKSKQKWEQNYDRKREWKEYKKEGWFANWFKDGGNVGRDLLFKSKQKWEQDYDRKREWKEYKKEGWLANWFKDGGEAKDFDFDGFRKRQAIISEAVKFAFVRAIGFDDAYNLLQNEDLSISPYRLVERAVSGEFIGVHEINKDVIESAIDEARRVTGRYKDSGQGIGSSDMTAFLKNFLDSAGFKTAFISSRLERIDENGNAIKVKSDLPNTTMFKYGGGIKSLFNKAKELTNKGVDATKKAIHDKKKEIALNVLYDMKENIARGKEEIIATDRAFRIVDEKYAKGGRVKNYKYVPNHMIESVDVERNGKTTEIDGGNILDGLYVKNVKFEEGGYIERIPTETLEGMVGRKLNGWNDDVVIYNGVAYKKCFMQPYYKIA